MHDLLLLANRIFDSALHCNNFLLVLLNVQVVYDICTRIVKLNSKQSEPIRLKSEGSGHKNGTEILDWNASHDSSQLQQRIEALQVS